MRIALLVEYDGTNYFGFQKQKLNQTKTIQYHIDQSIKKIANHDIKTACGGRTVRRRAWPAAESTRPARSP